MADLGFKRKAGILTPVFMLPNKFGIGGFGRESFDFIDFLKRTGQKVWQILPLNPTAYGDSPYQSPSSFAGNPYFIDPQTLYEEGLIEKKDLDLVKTKSSRIDYGFLFSVREPLLEKAYQNFKKDGLYDRFCQNNSYWLNDYALFSALKKHCNYAPWYEWEEDFKRYERAVKRKDEFKKQIDFYKFVQFKFDTMYQKVRSYANQNGILILGDMPIYVSSDSVDIWSRREQYLLDGFKPKIVAGCPPDGFSPDGQLWGNPIYDYEAMQKDGFSWWVERAKRMNNLYDIVRIDHFRGFAGYYAVPYGEKTARNGKWYPGVGYPLFEKIRQEVPDLKVVAEDLGLITEDVRVLMQKTGYPGMKMLQFAFYDDDAEYLPRNYANDNCVVYTGTHDSDASAHFIKHLKGMPKERFLKEVKIKEGQNEVDAFILFAHKSKAKLSVVPIIDYMHLSNRARINVPATAVGNWTVRLKSNYADKNLENLIYDLTKQGKRL